MCAARIFIDGSIPSRHAHPEKHTHYRNKCTQTHKTYEHTGTQTRRHGHTDTHNTKKDDYTNTETNTDRHTS